MRFNHLMDAMRYATEDLCETERSKVGFPLLKGGETIGEQIICQLKAIDGRLRPDNKDLIAEHSTAKNRMVLPYQKYKSKI